MVRSVESRGAATGRGAGGSARAESSRAESSGVEPSRKSPPLTSRRAPLQSALESCTTEHARVSRAGLRDRFGRTRLTESLLKPIKQSRPSSIDRATAARNVGRGVDLVTTFYYVTRRRRRRRLTFLPWCAHSVIDYHFFYLLVIVGEDTDFSFILRVTYLVRRDT